MEHEKQRPGAVDETEDMERPASRMAVGNGREGVGADRRADHKAVDEHLVLAVAAAPQAGRHGGPERRDGLDEPHSASTTGSPAPVRNRR